MKKRVVYVINSPAHKRCVESFVERPDLEQLVLGPAPSKSKYVPEDYSDFKIKNLKYIKPNEPNSIMVQIREFKPDIYVQPDLTPIHNTVATMTGKYKRVFVSHGMIGNHVIDLMKIEKFNTSVWHGLDLYCGADKIFADWVKYAAGNKEVLLNAFPQLDILHDPNYYNSYRQKILSKTKLPQAKKIILFIGFAGKDRADFKYHNEDYFRTAIELAEMAKRNDWLVMIKPRQEHDRNMLFLGSVKWGKRYREIYHNLRNHKNVHFIDAANAHIYRYYFADAFVVNGCSTAEIEICAIQKPLFIVRTDLKCLQSGYDPYNTVSSGAAMPIPDLSELEHDLLECFNNGKLHYPEKQKILLDTMGIYFDGQHHKRIQDKLKEL